MASVASRNLFDILGDSEDADSVKEKEPSAKEPPVVKKKVDRSRAHPQEKGIRFDYPQRGGHKGSASNRNEDTRPVAPRDRNVGPRLSGRSEEGGGGGGGRGSDYPARNSRGARPSDRDRGGRGRGRRGREFDKHSGTGKHDSEKKETQGWGNPAEPWQNNNPVEQTSWNAETNDNAAASSTWDDNANDTSTSGWANNTTEEKSEWNADATEEKSEEKNAWGATEETTTETNKWDQQPESTAWVDGNEGTKTNWEEGVEEPKNEDIATGDSAPVPEPEEIVKTLDEYRAEQKVLDIPLPEARKPNEGVDDSQWKDAVPLEKDEEEDFIFAGKEQSYRLKSKKNKSKNYLEITQTFVERPGSGSSRGRGRGRGGRGSRGRDDRDGRSNYRDNYDDNNRDNRRRGSGGGRSGHVNLDDQRAFPSLGA